jgi:hypothetical protein
MRPRKRRPKKKSESKRSEERQRKDRDGGIFFSDFTFSPFINKIADILNHNF